MFGNTFLHSFDNDPLFAGSFIVEHASVLMSISQISETLFILTIRSSSAATALRTSC